MALKRLCFMGASNVEGVGDEERRGWAGRLTMMPPALGTPTSFFNLGIGGETTDQIADRWERECRIRIADDMDGALVISFGLNDCAEIEGEGIRIPLEQTIANVTAAATNMKAWKPTVWVGPTPVAEDMMPMRPRPGVVLWHANDRLKELNASYAKVALELDIPYMDLLTPLLESDVYMASLHERDGLHPSGAGYQVAADLIAAWQPWQDLFK